MASDGKFSLQLMSYRSFVEGDRRAERRLGSWQRKSSSKYRSVTSPPPMFCSAGAVVAVDVTWSKRFLPGGCGASDNVSEVDRAIRRNFGED